MEGIEEYTRRLVQVYDSVFVWCGAVVISGKKIGQVGIPDYCWKIIYTKRSGAVEAYSFKNDNTDTDKLDNYRISLDSIQRLSGLRLLE